MSRVSAVRQWRVITIVTTHTMVLTLLPTISAFVPSTSVRHAVYARSPLPLMHHIDGEQHDELLATHIEDRWAWMVDNPGLELERERASGELNSMQMQKDLRLAERDTRRWCLDRCLSTGYCDVIEDLWSMSTEQVIVFCRSCADADECALDYTLADEYLSNLQRAALEPPSLDELLEEVLPLKVPNPAEVKRGTV